MTDYGLLCEQLAALAEEEAGWVPLLSNASALLYEALPELNWAGFYVRQDEKLVLGPFQGKVACIHIPLGKGVCGTAAATGETQRVRDVHAFPGHIACDGASNAEIVVPLRRGGEVVAVLDLDSPVFDRFTPEDQSGLEAFARILEEKTDWGSL
ncbi:MAG: GAF domain-containing protein [Oscillospiraceae bacterium]|nr:GAF domain-containing protein [Oscillospiraceae bacterium]